MMDISAIAAGLEQRADGIWYARVAAPVSYPESDSEEFFQLEDRSFWFQHRNACILALVAAFPTAAGTTIFDIGGGNGFVAAALQQTGREVVLLEPGAAGAARAKQRGIKTVVCASLEAAGFSPGTLGAVGLFDVIEHVEDDVAFLRYVRRLVVEGSLLYATVPAHQALWSDEDVAAGHFRRYSIRSICEALSRAGFKAIYSTYIFRPLPVPIFLRRSLPFRLCPNRQSSEGRNVASGHEAASGVLGKALRRILAPEIGKIADARRMRFGGSVLIVAEAR
jgi:SAM-dependent methyltransferase